ncbi:MAG TPA: M20 family metallopeptidase [Anaerolineae bacterium]|nr:M20 family metallopeptidase [Anaerolineae bacterium]
MLDRAQAIAEQLVTWRRTIHQHPERSFREVQTARLVAEALQGMGIDAQTGIGCTGVVGRLGGGPRGRDGPTIALRADMDALPIREETGLPFASQVPGVMHACGHDAHVACLLGAAALLAETPPQRGEVRFLFQPSEETVDQEGKGGAARMVDDGAMHGVEAIVGLHTWPEVPVGQVSLSPGPQMAAAGKFFVEIRGQGGHGAAPHQTVDPIVLAAQAILALQTVVSRRLDPIEAGVVTVGTIHGGTQDNIIPESVTLTGTLRGLSSDVYDQLVREVRHTLGVVRALGGDLHVEFTTGYPVTTNNAQLTALVTQVARDLLGAEAAIPARPVMKGEDFSVLAAHVPGCYMRLGTGLPGEPPRRHHDPRFDIDERALPIGAAILAETALRYLSR